jgi:hypothetical protein
MDQLADDSITLDLPTAKTLLMMAQSMKGPTTPENVGMGIRAAHWLLPRLMEAFEEAGVDPDDIAAVALPPVPSAFTQTSSP